MGCWNAPDNADADFSYAQHQAEREGRPLVSLIRFDGEQAADMEAPEVRQALSLDAEAEREAQEAQAEMWEQEHPEGTTLTEFACMSDKQRRRWHFEQARRNTLPPLRAEAQEASTGPGTASQPKEDTLWTS